jgi:DNA-binding response OmpR family regulator
VALRRIRDLQPDLALVDVNLIGELSGLDVAHELQESGSMRIISLTAFGDLVDRDPRAAQLPILLKPFQPDDLAEILSEVLRED